MHLFCLPKQNGHYALHYKCSQVKVYCKHPTAKILL